MCSRRRLGILPTSPGCRTFPVRRLAEVGTMHPEELLAAVRRRPFVPFRLHIADGSSYDIRHPEMILVTRRTAFVGIPGEPGQVAERAVTVVIPHISRLEEIATAATGNRQGSA